LNITNGFICVVARQLITEIIGHAVNTNFRESSWYNTIPHNSEKLIIKETSNRCRIIVEPTIANNKDSALLCKIL